MSGGLISIEISKDKVIKLTINRPKSLNALNTSLLQELDNTLSGLLSDSANSQNFKLLLIQGAGEKAFVAGADIKEFSDMTHESLDSFVTLGQRVMKRISDFPCPTMAFVKGYCLGGGFELALSCDLIAATEDAKFSFPEVTLGLIPGFGGTQRILRRVGNSSAKFLIFTGEQINADKASELGIVNYILPQNSYQEDLGKICEKIVSLPQDALRAAKRSIDTSVSVYENNGLDKEKNEFIGVFFSDNAVEGRTAFIENRTPNFKDK